MKVKCELKKEKVEMPTVVNLGQCGEQLSKISSYNLRSKSFWKNGTYPDSRSTVDQIFTRSQEVLDKQG